MHAPEFWYNGKTVPIWARWLSHLYGRGRAMHVASTQALRAPLPTICVGNLTVGGAGKTPVSMALRGLLADQAPWILLRGYGGTVRGPHRVLPDDSPSVVGDEALLHRRYGPVVVARDRGQGAAMIAQQPGARLIIMDDGLQNRHIAPQIRIGVFDGMIGIGNGMMLPAGPLRVPFDEGVMNLDAAVIIGDDQTGLRARLPADMPLFTAQLVPDWQQIDRAVRYVAVAGIGRPEKFFTMLRDAGVTLAETISFPDHHSYTKPDMTRLDDRARVHGATLITTEKDLVKMAALTMQPITTVPIRAVFDDPDGMRDFVLKSLSS